MASTLKSYSPPAWAASIPFQPKSRLPLAQIPTPVQLWAVPGLPRGLDLFIKRDDLTGMQLSGNKVRKLEFILADALERGADSLITLGGIQSNHARATAVAARYAGLDSHLILRAPGRDTSADPGLGGNLLLDRAVGAAIHLVTKETYGRDGQARLAARLARRLERAGKKPYVVPVGGSSPIGAWGYIHAVEELIPHLKQHAITDIILATGSGGTLSGTAIGVRLAGLDVRVRAYSVCDSPDAFYEHVDETLEALGLGEGTEANLRARSLAEIRDAKGAGYAIPREAELRTLLEVSRATGVVVEPVYTGKALHAWLGDVRADPASWEGKKVLFIHTGGLLGTYAVEQPLLKILNETGGIESLGEASDGEEAA